MKVSTNTCSFTKKISYEKTVELIAKAGFDAWDFSMFDMIKYDYANACVVDTPHPLNGSEYIKFCRTLKHVADDNGIHCNQSHAPFPICIKEIRDYAKRAIECTAEVGGDICVVHPDNDGTAEQNAEFYLGILPFAKEHGVRIATENMYNWREGHSIPAACSSPQDFVKHVDLVSDDSLVACLDIGHAEMFGVDTSAPEMIRELGHKRLKALHIHDNNKWNDLHDIPFSGKIDFNEIAKALKEIKYDGYLTLEADSHPEKFDVKDMDKCAKELYESVNRLRELILK